MGRSGRRRANACGDLHVGTLLIDARHVPPSLPRRNASRPIAPWLVAATALSGAGCDSSGAHSEPGPAPSTSAWGRAHAPNAAASSGLAVPGPPNESALTELLANVPELREDTTGPDGGTLIGSTTDVAEDDSPNEEPAGESRSKAVVKLGTAKKQPGLSSAGIERALRASLYYELVQRCRGPGGNLLPAEAIKLQFTVAADGTIAPSTIAVTAEAPEHRDAASCMRRTLSAVSFRGPSSARGQTTDVTALVPSVD